MKKNLISLITLHISSFFFLYIFFLSFNIITLVKFNFELICQYFFIARFAFSFIKQKRIKNKNGLNIIKL